MVSGGIVHEVALISLPAGGEGALQVDEPLQEIDCFFRRENHRTHNQSSSLSGLGICLKVSPRKERSLDLCLDRSPSELDIFLCDLLLMKRKDPLIYDWITLRVNRTFFSVISSLCLTLSQTALDWASVLKKQPLMVNSASSKSIGLVLRSGGRPVCSELLTALDGGSLGS
jgi:hypothetical protein